MAGISSQLTPQGQALLEVISGDESKGAYDVIYGGSKFSDFSDHPRQAIPIKSGPNAGKTSSAAGKYQFIGSTWDDIAGRYDINDFSPQSQDRAAWALAQEEYKRDTGRSLQTDLEAGDLSRVAPSLRNQWTSLPGGIEQGAQANTFANRFWGSMGINLGAMPDLNALTNATAGAVPGLGSRPSYTGAAPSGVVQGPRAGNTPAMNALAAKYVARGGADVGLMPSFGEMSIFKGGGATLPTLPGQTRTQPIGAKKPTIFDAIGGYFNDRVQGIAGIGTTLNSLGTAANGAVKAGQNPLKAMASIGVGQLPNNNAGQAVRAAMGFKNPNVGMTLGTAANGGTVVQGKNGAMNSITQSSDAWKKATGQSSYGSGQKNDTRYESYF